STMAIQNKRVHFSESPVMYTYPTVPRTPSPSWSDNSLPDNDSGPSTPPSSSSQTRTLPFAHEHAKQHIVPSPLIFDMRIQSTPLVWDAVTPAMYAAVRTGRKGKGKELRALLPSDLASAATVPAVTSMDVHIAQLPSFWKPIQLRSAGSPHSSPSRSILPITVGEVLDAIHRYIHATVSQREFGMFPKNMQDAVAKAYWKRHDTAVRSGNVTEAESIKKSGMRRVDVLAGMTQFVALEPPSSVGGVWRVTLAPTTRL
ncbi:hypothetical protein DFH11DRAFT_1514809, partial [Phellopilus nigrolimitatus]